MTDTTARPDQPRRYFRHALQFTAGCVCAAAFFYGCYLLTRLDVPAAFAFVLPSALASWIYSRWERRTGGRG